MTNYKKGRTAEYELKHKLEAQGYTVLRTAGSHGPFDLIALSESGPVRLIQVKSGVYKNVVAWVPPLMDNSCYTQELWVRRPGGDWDSTIY